MAPLTTRLHSLAAGLFLSLAIAALTFTRSASAHSWVRCTDYRVADPRAAPQGPQETDQLRRIYDEAACGGYSPSFPANTGFGQDSGYEHRPAGNQLCLPRANTYSDERPMATYNAGRTVCLAYPAKNHVAARCPGNGGTNEFIPDTGVKIYRSSMNPPSNSFAPMSDFQANELRHLNGEHAQGVVDYLGFQNCPEFCGAGGTDRVLCTMCFELEPNLSPGMYQFAWDWEFNVGERYSTCWSAQVLAADGSGGTPGAGPGTGNPGDGAGGNPDNGGSPDSGNPDNPRNDGSSVTTDGGDAPGGGGGLSVGAAVGVTLVVVLVVGIAFAAAYNLWWKKRHSHGMPAPSEYTV